MHPAKREILDIEATTGRRLDLRRAFNARLMGGGGWAWSKKKKPEEKKGSIVLCDECIKKCMRVELDKTPKKAGGAIPRFDPKNIVRVCKEECQFCQKTAQY